MVEASIERFSVNEGPLKPGQTAMLFKNVLVNNGPKNEQTRMYYVTARVDANGSVLQTICDTWVDVDGDLKFGIRNHPNDPEIKQCDPEPRTQKFRWTVPEDVGSKFYMGFKVWTGDQGQPEFPAPGTPEANQGNARTWAVNTTVEEPVPIPGPNSDIATAGLLLAGITGYGAANQRDIPDIGNLL